MKSYKNSVSERIPRFYRSAGGPMLLELLRHLDNQVEYSLEKFFESFNPKLSLIAAKTQARNLGWGFMLDLDISPANPNLIMEIGSVKRHDWQSAIEFWLKYFYDMQFDLRVIDSLTSASSKLSLDLVGSPVVLSRPQREIVYRLKPAHLAIGNEIRS